LRIASVPETIRNQRHRIGRSESFTKSIAEGVTESLCPSLTFANFVACGKSGVERFGRRHT
jgi:hypothetical protein